MIKATFNRTRKERSCTTLERIVRDDKRDGSELFGDSPYSQRGPCASPTCKARNTGTCIQCGCDRGLKKTRPAGLVFVDSGVDQSLICRDCMN